MVIGQHQRYVPSFMYSFSRGSNVIGMWMRIFGMCFQYGVQSSLRAKTVSIVFLIIHICIDTAPSRISRFGGKTCPVYIHTQYVSSKWVFQKLLSKFHRKIVAVLRTSLITRVDTLYSRFIGPYLLVSLHSMIKYWIVETIVHNLVQRKAAFWLSRVRN